MCSYTNFFFFFSAFPVSLETALDGLHGFSEERVLERLFAHKVKKRIFLNRKMLLCLRLKGDGGGQQKSYSRSVEELIPGV